MKTSRTVSKSTRIHGSNKIFKYTHQNTHIIPKNINEDDNFKFSKEFDFVTDVSNGFSLKPAGEYLKSSTEGLIIAHLQREIKKEKEKLELKRIKKRESDVNDLIDRLNALNEILTRKYQYFLNLQIELETISKLFTRLMEQCQTPMLDKQFRDVVYYDEVVQNLLSIHNTMIDALSLREERKLKHEMNAAIEEVIQRNTQKNRERVNEIREKMMKKKTNNLKYFKELSEIRDEYYTTLAEKNNALNRDIVMPMKEILEWVDTNDPVIALNRMSEGLDNIKIPTDYFLVSKKLNDEEMDLGPIPDTSHLIIGPHVFNTDINTDNSNITQQGNGEELPDLALLLS